MPQIIGSDVTSLRHVNRDGALQQLRRTPDRALSASDVADELGLSRPTAARLLTELSESGWAQLQLAHTGSAGRPTRTFSLARRARLVAAIDLGPNNLLVALADLSGEVLSRSYAPHAAGSDDASIADAACAALLGLLDAESEAHGGLASVVISLPATVDRAGHIRAWHDSPAWATDLLPELLSERLGALPSLKLHSLKMHFEGSPLASVRAEQQHGVIAAGEDVVFVLAGDVTGAAPIVEGRAYRGSSGAAGDIGALPGVDWKAATEAALRRTGAASLHELVELGLRGEAEPRRALADYAHHLASGVEVLIRAFDPATLVLGGCLAPAGSLVLGPLGAALDDTLGTSPHLVCAGVDHVDAPMLGGLSVALDLVEWGA